LAPQLSQIISDYYFGSFIYKPCTFDGEICVCPKFYSVENNACKYVKHVPVQLSQQIVLLISIVAISLFFYSLSNYIRDYASRLVDDVNVLSKLKKQNKKLEKKLKSLLLIQK
jgi:hypothetical protein